MSAVNKESVAVFAVFRYPRTSDFWLVAATVVSYIPSAIKNSPSLEDPMDGFTLFISAIRRLTASFAKPEAEFATASESIALKDPTVLVSAVVVSMFLSSCEKCWEKVANPCEGVATKEASSRERYTTLRVIMLRSPRTVAVSRLTVGAEKTRVDVSRRGKRVVRSCIVKVLNAD